ncbi:MAG: hypothetical protein KGJ35_02740 [Patescibacteria group bacterium]|nr:hypothetical protein [Patescibacteria group bacterium]
MKNITKIITATVGAALAVVFTIALAAPSSANACFGGCGVHYSQSSYVSTAGYNYSYGSRPQPIVITQPQIIYTQPQTTYVQSQPQYIYQQPTYQPAPVYYPQPTYYSPLTVSCYANPTSVSVGQSVTWTAYASGGNGSYTYNWSGTNNTYNSYGSTAYSTYYNPGSYSASVTVYSNGQSVTQSCGYVSVIGSYAYNYQPTYYGQPTYVQPVVQPVLTPSPTGDLVAACYADRTAASIGTPVTWSVETTGGSGQYTYNWSGTEGLAGSGSSVVKSYYTAGNKNATVLITSSNGETLSQACGASVQIRTYVAPATTNYQGATTTVTPNQNNQANSNALSANALFSLGNIPWGWIAILIIIILIATVFYLLFNRHKA